MGRKSQRDDCLFQRLPVDKLHGVVIDALLLANGEHRHDMWMVKLGSCLSFVAKAGNLPLI